MSATTLNPQRRGRAPFRLESLEVRQLLSTSVSFTQNGQYLTTQAGVSVVLTAQLGGDPATTPISVPYTTVDGTGKAGIDYVPTSGTLQFPLGTTQQQITVAILNSKALTQNKDFFVQLQNPTTDEPPFFQLPPDVPPPTYVLVSPSTADVTVANINSAFEINPGNTSVTDDQSAATVTVQRLGISSDEEKVDFSTVAISGGAIAGLTYTPVHETLDFSPGQLSQTVQVPLLENGPVGQTQDILLQLSNPQIIQPAVGTATAQNAFVRNSPQLELPAGVVVPDNTGVSYGVLSVTNVDTVPPAIQSLNLTNDGKRITSITLDVSKPLSQASAQSLDSYGIFKRHADGPYASGRRTQVKLASAAYNSSTNTVVITPKRPLRMNHVYQFVAYGNGGVTDLAGRPIQSNAAGAAAGPNYSTFFGQGNKLTYTDADGDRVKLKLKGGGIMDLRRAFDGTASTLTLLDTNSASTLSGNVHRARHGDGLATINLLGPTGGVNDLLTNPPFIIQTVT